MWNEAEQQKLGLMTSMMGIFFLLFGVSMMFDRAMLASGNFLLVSGLVTAIGYKRSTSFFFSRSRLKGTIFLLGGVVLVFVQWAIFGILSEFIGIIYLFKYLPFILFSFPCANAKTNQGIYFLYF